MTNYGSGVLSTSKMAAFRAREGRGARLSRSQGTLRPGRQQFRSQPIQVRETEGSVRLGQILPQPAVSGAMKSPLPLDHQKHVLTARSHPRPAPVDLAPAVRNRPVPVSTPIHAVTDA